MGLVKDATNNDLTYKIISCIRDLAARSGFAVGFTPATKTN